MAQANDSTTTTLAPATTPARLSFKSAGAVRRRPAQPVPSVVAHGTWFIPVIDHSGRPSYVRFARYPRKAKPTLREALEYANRVIAWREHFEGFKRRREAALFSSYLDAAE